jgi:hypothetical protein
MDETALFSGYKRQRMKSHKRERGGHNRKATRDPEQRTRKKTQRRTTTRKGQGKNPHLLGADLHHHRPSSSSASHFQIISQATA